MANLALTVVEIDLPRCGIFYGIAPCAAAIPTTGSTKCFNCASTCQDVENFENSTQILRLYKNSQHIPNIEFQGFNNVRSITINAQKIFPGENLGKRETGTIICNNHREGDEWFDKYIGHRISVDGYIPYERGTFWGRMIARYPNMEGFPLRILNGLYQDVPNKLDVLEVSHYVISKVSYDATDGVKIDFTDVLNFVESGKSLLPRPSNGQLNSDISTGLVSFTLKPSGIGNEEYPSSGLASIGKELVSFTRSADVVNLTARGLMDTETKTHSENDTFQIAVVLEGRGSEIFGQILSYTDVPEDYKRQDVWDQECAAYNPRLYEAVVAEPTDVVKLTNDLMVDCALDIHTDVVKKAIELKIVRNTMPTFLLTNGNCDDIRPTIDSEKRISAIYTQYGRQNPLEKMDESNNYPGKLLTLDPNPQNALQTNTPKIRKRFSRFIQSTGRQSALEINNLMISRYNKPLRGVELKMAITDNPPKLSEVGILNIEEFEGTDGGFSIIPVQVIQRSINYPEVELLLEEFGANYLEDDGSDIRIISIVIDYTNLIFRQLHDAEWGSDPIPAGTEVIFECDEDIKIGHGKLAAEDWPEVFSDGVIVTIKRARMYGRGGNGGTNGHPNGHNGLTAFYTRVTVNLIECTIGGGGGGGGGSMVAEVGSSYGIFYNGAGGAGYPPGAGSGASITSAASTMSGGQSSVAGDGGNIGQNGGTGSGGPLTHYTGGSSGPAIDGVSFCTKTTCTIFGSEIN